MKYTSNERGVLPIVVALLVVALVAVAGFAVYNASKAHNKDTQSLSVSPSSSPVSTASPAATSTPAAKVFVVKELDIQFPVTDDIKDLQYAIRTLGDGSKGADFSSASLVAAGGKGCAADAGANPLGTITLTSNANFPDGQKVKQLGSKFLYYVHAQSVCWPGTTADSLSQAQINSFRNALNSAQLVQ